MLRDISISEISDGKFYRLNDLVKADTGGCTGCSRCCCGMGESILLDPYDIFHLSRDAGYSFEALMDGKAAFGLSDGLVLPHIDMSGPDERCAFLNEEGRCSIHKARPGFCRLFPLGRYYEGDDFVYFLQVHECDHARAKVKVRRWIDIPDPVRYDQYISEWHALLRLARRQADESENAGPAGTQGNAPQTAGADETAGSSSGLRRIICTLLLRIFYQQPWDTSGDFYAQFEVRKQDMYRSLGIAC